jgi:hypothetical protein
MASIDKATLVSSLQALRKIVQARRTRRIGIGLLIFLVVFGLLGFFAAPPLVRHIAQTQLSAQLDRPASIGRIAFNPYTLRLEADRIHIGERGGQGDFVDIARLVVKPSWASLLHAAPIVDELRVDSPRIHLIRYDAQRFNFSDLIAKFAKQPARPSSKPTLFSVSNIHVENGEITFDDRLLGVKHVIDQWQLGVPFIATLPSKTDIFVQPLLRGRIDGSAFALDGKTKPFAASRESDLSLRFDGLDVPHLLSYAPQKLPVTVQSGKLSTALQISFVMAGQTPSLRVSGTLDLKDVNVLDGNHRPFFAARGLHVAAATLEPLKRIYHFDQITLDTPRVDLTREKDGTLSIMRTFAGAPAGTAAPVPASASAAASASAPASAPAASAAAASGSAVSASASSAASASASTASAPVPASPLDLAIGHFTLEDGALNVQDNSVAHPVTLGLTHLAVSLTGFSTRAAAPAHYTVSAGLSGNPGTLDATGTFGLAARRAEAKLALKSLSLPFLQPYLDGVTAAQVTDGALSVAANVKADWAKSPAQITLGESQLDLQSLKIALRGSHDTALALAHGDVKIRQVDVAARVAQIAGIDANGLVIDAQRLKDGRIDLAGLASPPAQRGEAAPPRPRAAAHPASDAHAPAAAPGWHYTIDEVSVQDSAAHFTDNVPARPVKLSIDPLQLKVEHVSDNFAQALPVELRATLNRKGTLALRGDVTAQPLKLALKVDAHRLDAAAFEPYFGERLNVTVASALLNMNGELAVAEARKDAHAARDSGALSASYRGNAALVDVRMLDKLTSDPLAGWGSLALTNLKARYDAQGTDVDAARVNFSNFYGRVILSPQGKLNLSDIVVHEGSTPESLTRSAGTNEPVPLSPGAASAAQAGSATVAASASAPPPAPAASAVPASGAAAAEAAAAPASPMKLHFGELVLQQGHVNYTDNFIKPNYSANLVAIHGSVGAFGTQSTTPAPVDIEASLAANGPISIQGTVNPLIPKPALDITATAHDIELTNLSPYSTKYAGYPITKGKLNVDLHYKLDNDLLSANNHVFIDQLTFGDHVDNTTATRLPVRLAIALLKNSRGEIDVNIPVSGSLSNPEFSLGGLIWHAVLNLLEKAVTAPFSLLADAFGGNAEEMGYVTFAPGSATLSDAAQKKLDTIAKALADKPSVRIDLTGRADPAIDTPALRTAYVERLVRQQKIRSVVGNGESVDLSKITVEPQEYDKYLTRAYKDASFKKPHNFLGLTKTLPADDMKRALAEHAPIDEGSLRTLAQRRAQSVQQYLTGKIDSSRIFIVAPKLDAKGIKDKGAPTRVDFGLH